MSDIYEATYNAVRSKFPEADVFKAVQDGVRDKIDYVNLPAIFQDMQSDFSNATLEMQRPCVVFKPTISIDGDQYCVLLGENLQEGCAGFGETLSKAMYDFDKNFENYKPGPK